MATGIDQPSVLVVDDNPANLLALETVLREVDGRIVLESSGRGALRRVLEQSFAVILIDINMPGMDGFETTALIRQHRHGKGTPIIFLTAAADDPHVEKSCSLGAVDYMLTPVVPHVLTTKVRVFLELFRANERMRRQAESLEFRGEQLRKLTRASLAMHASTSIDEIVRTIVDAARDIVRVERAFVMLGPLRQGDGRRVETSYSESHRALHEPGSQQEVALSEMMMSAESVVRVTAGELGQYLLSHGLRSGSEELGMRRIRLLGPAGHVFGCVIVSRKVQGDLTGEDEDILQQLAQLGSAAIQASVDAEVREAGRLKDEFLATLSHELRTPLTVIAGWTRMLRSGQPAPEKLGRGLEIIERNVQAQIHLVDELLDVSRIATGKLDVELCVIPLAPIVGVVVEGLRPLAEGKGLELASRELSPALVVGDAERLRQVLHNVVSNAIKFTPKGGRIEVSLEPVGEAFELCVTDNGGGIDPEFLPLVFDRFRQADSTSRRSYGGLGIGLSVVKHIVELHGGWVRAESRGLGEGATIVIGLPAAPASRDGAEHGRDSESTFATRTLGVDTPDLGGVRVLVVEDESDAQDLIGAMLIQHHADVTAVGSVREALAAMAIQRPDVIVSDIALPGEDGYDFIRRIRGRAPEEGGDVPAIALTAYATNEDRMRVLTAGFQMYASKPVEKLMLVQAVASLVGGRAQ